LMPDTDCTSAIVPLIGSMTSDSTLKPRARMVAARCVRVARVAATTRVGVELARIIDIFAFWRAFCARRDPRASAPSVVGLETTACMTKIVSNDASSGGETVDVARGVV